MDREELIDFVIQERRGTCFYGQSAEKRKVLAEMVEDWKKQLEEVDPELLKIPTEYLDAAAEVEAMEEEACYLRGFQDGVDLMKRITNFDEKGDKQL